MRMMAVRCCCQPQKVLGYLPVPTRIEAGHVVRYAKCGDRVPFVEELRGKKVATVDLRVQEIRMPGRYGFDTELALKGEGMVVEDVENLAGYKDHP